jgi:CRP-like cAMP-binding protein
MTANPSASAHWNRLLAALPQPQRDRLLAQLEPVDLELKQIVAEPNVPIPFVYFVLTGVISLVLNVEEDGLSEVATVGNEGFVGVPILLGADSTPLTVMCQIPGSALRMPAADFRAQIQQDEELRTVLGHYTQALFNQISQATACNRLHPIEQRCARWLLMTWDRVHSDHFPLTQEFLAQMLGVRRPSVSVVANLLQRAGLIRYSRGIMTITDPAGLEAATCSCYRVIRDEYDRLLGTVEEGR